MVWKLVSPWVQLPSSCRMRGVTAIRRLATSRPLGVERSSGSAVRLPTRVTRSVSDMGPSLGLGGPGGPGAARYQGESRMLDWLERVCPGQAGLEYPATSVPFSKAVRARRRGLWHHL